MSEDEERIEELEDRVRSLAAAHDRLLKPLRIAGAFQIASGMLASGETFTFRESKMQENAEFALRMADAIIAAASEGQG